MSAPTRVVLRCIWPNSAPESTGIDASRAALEVAEENLEVNRHRIQASVEWIEANAFRSSSRLEHSGEHF